MPETEFTIYTVFFIPSNLPRNHLPISVQKAQIPLNAMVDIWRQISLTTVTQSTSSIRSRGHRKPIRMHRTLIYNTGPTFALTSVLKVFTSTAAILTKSATQ